MGWKPGHSTLGEKLVSGETEELFVPRVGRAGARGMAVTHHPKKNKRTPIWSMALLSAPDATTSFLSLSRPLISSGADLWGPPMPLVCRLGLSLRRKQAQRDGVTGLRSHSQKGRRGKLMTRTGLRGGKAMGVTVKARAWPPSSFLLGQGDSSRGLQGT